MHPIESWNDLRNPRLPNEPLIFVEIALLKGLPDTVQLVLDHSAPPQDPRAACRAGMSTRRGACCAC